MYKQRQRPNVTCPLIDDFHVQNILGARERRELIFGSRVTITDGFTYKSLTLSALSGGWVTSVDHYEVLAQEVGVYNTGTGLVGDMVGTPTIVPYVINKTAIGFDLHGDTDAVMSVVIKATLPAHPRSNAKDAWSYCPYCKFFGFKDIVGSVVRDATIFGGKATTSSGTVAVTFGNVGTASAAILSKPTKTYFGQEGKDGTEAIGFQAQVGGGSLKKSLVTTMIDTQYQIIIQASKYTPGGGTTTYPYPTLITDSGFLLNGDTAYDYDVLILGQVKN
jgi:hypothetical protein